MRKSRAKKRVLLPDPKFQDKLVTRFVNNLMLDGKKSTAFEIFYSALEIVNEKVEEEDSLDVWKKALTNVTPGVEVRSRRIGGATFQIPQPIRDDRNIYDYKYPSWETITTENGLKDKNNYISKVLYNNH